MTIARWFGSFRPTTKSNDRAKREAGRSLEPVVKQSP